MTKSPNGVCKDFFVGPSERDPLGAARQSSRPPLPKRFYATAQAAPLDDGFTVLLDGKPLKTPGRRPLVVPWAALAAALGAEWSALDDVIDPAALPLTRLVNTAIDGVAERLPETEADIVKYAAFDLLCHRAETPESLVQAQAGAWNPLLAFARDKLGGQLMERRGLSGAPQPQEAVAALARAVRAYVGDGPQAPFRLAALHVMTTLTGSLVIALAAALGEIGVEAAWSAAHVDEDFQMRAWGADAEALARRAARFTEMRAAAFIADCAAGRVRESGDYGASARSAP